MKSEPCVSIIILTHNSEVFIQQCIETISNLSYKDYEIIIIDNASTDKTREILTNMKINATKEVKIILNSVNLGYNLGNLEGIKNSKGEFIAIINPDVTVNEDWLNNIIEFFHKNLKLMIVSGKLLNKDNTIQNAGGVLDIYGATKQKTVNRQERLFYQHGAAFVFKRKILEKINFDPNLFMYYDDVDFAWQSRLLGYQIEYCEKAIAIHDEHQGKEQDSLQFYNISKNRIYVCAKNYSLNRKIKRMWKIIAFVLADSIYYSYKFKSIKYFGVFFKAIFWNIVNLKKMQIERKKIQKIRIKTDEEIEKFMKKKSIEIEFLRN